MDGALAEVLGEGRYVVHEEASAKGRPGSPSPPGPRRPPSGLAPATPDAAFDGAGRWVEADPPAGDGRVLTVISAYVHTGEAPSYAERWSDHAPVVVEYDVDFI